MKKIFNLDSSSHIEFFESETIDDMVYLTKDDFNKLAKKALSVPILRRANVTIDHLLQNTGYLESRVYRDPSARHLIEDMRKQIYFLADELKLIKEM